MTCVRCVAAILVIVACSGKSNQSASTPSSAGAGGGGAAGAMAPAREAGETGASAGASTAPAGGGASSSVAAAGPNGLPPPPMAPMAPPVPAVKVTLADVGLEAASLDRTADPCVDFYQFACGGWIQNNPIPADRAGWSRDSEVDERNKAAIKTLLEDAARPTATSPATKKLGAYYASCMDEAAIERTGAAAFAPLLARTRGVVDARTWLAVVIELHKLGIEVVWSNHVTADLKDSATNVTYLDAAGLGLPDRDYYVKPELKDKLDGYRAHVGKVLALVAGPARLDAADTIAIESEIAKLTKTAVERRDVGAAYNPTDAKALGKQVKSVDWPAYWKGLGAQPSKKIIVGTPRLFAGLDKLRARWKPAQWASYFTYHLAQAMAHAMSRQLDEQAFELRKLLTGVEKQRDRSKRCIDQTIGALGELLGEAYVASYFPGSAKQNATRLVDALVQAMTNDIAGLPWMADAIRTAGRPTTSTSSATTSPATRCARPHSRSTASWPAPACRSTAASGR
jgi:putative endopeptidase